MFPVVLAGLATRKADADEDRGSPFMNTLLVTTIARRGRHRDALLARTDIRTGTRLASIRPRRRSCAPRRPSSPPGSRLFVSQTYASWFEFELPSMPVFVDSRIELFPASLWDDYLAVGGAREGWQSTLDRWDVDAVVINPDQDEQLLAHIADDPGWRLAFRDESGSVFVRS